MSPAIEPEYCDNMAQHLDRLRNLKPSSDASELHGIKNPDIDDPAGQKPNQNIEVVSIASSEKAAPSNPWNTWNSGAKDHGGNKAYD